MSVSAVVAAVTGLAVAASAAGTDTTIRRLVEAENSRSFSVETAAVLRSDDADMAARAALALGRTRDARAAGPLKNATRDSRVPVRALAVYGYGLLAGRTGVTTGPVLRVLSDAAPAVRITAADAAGRLAAADPAGTTDLIGPLERLAAASGDPGSRGRAIIALAAWRSRPQAPRIAVALSRIYAREPDPEVRRRAAWSLRRAYSQLLTPETLARGLRDADEETRIQFVAAVARRGGGGPAEAQLAPLLRDPSWRVRESALEAVRALEGLAPTAHLTAIPRGVVTPPPQPRTTEAALPRTPASGKPRRPTVVEALAVLHTRPRVRLRTTQGDVVLRLHPDWAPFTVANFLALANRGYYDGNRWFRIVPDFVVQSGDPHDDGEGDAGYTIAAEENPIDQHTGIISMGLNYTDGKHGPPGPIRDSAGTQFYVTLSPQFHLDRDFTVFGDVESGFPVLGRLTERDRIVRIDRLRDR